MSKKPPSDATPTPPRVRPPIAGWKKALLALSCALMVLGAGLYAWGRLAADAPPAPATAGPDGAPSAVPDGLVSGFDQGAPTMPGPDGTAGSGPGEGDPDAASPPDALTAWSPAIFRLGFGFAAGFAVGYAIRGFLKITVFAFGALLIALIALQFAGVLEINWGALEGRYDQIVAWLSSQTTNVTTFLQGSLPSSASGAVGLTVGLKKK